MGLFNRGRKGEQDALQLPAKFELIRELGRGSNGVVYLARDSAARGAPQVAVKLIECNSATNERKVTAILREVFVHSAAKAAHIVPVLETFRTGTHVGIVMEYIQGGDLLEYINKRGPLPENQARWVFQQLMYAVRYVHQKLESMHRDIKLDNIMVHDPSVDFPMIYLCDFSFAKAHGTPHGDTVSVVGSADYFAPEILLRKAPDMRYDGMVADLFSCGVCLFVMIYGRYPKSVLRKRSEDDVYQFGLDGIEMALPKRRHVGNDGSEVREVSAEALALMAGLMRPDPANRLRMEGVWADPWFRRDLPPGAEAAWRRREGGRGTGP
ncbi:unnamed protein product [Ostreobium quekettii]|uniref:Protein kinase domain-containing protein n=1 Tax=Ostreobium quekettii TaxID=121088 RepID=A0A8S1IU09_9CHLO|nr:unnamed protein product [Ostreobium quekettii]